MLEARTSSVRRAPVTILVVEDDREMRELLVDTLERDGYLVLAAASANEAERILATTLGQRRLEVDLVLSDVQMDGLTGIELGQRLREANGATPLILMTAFPEASVDRAASDIGATVLPKPFRLEVLRRAVLTTIAARARASEERL
jgi:CheY-like chemotaxis protein